MGKRKKREELDVSESIFLKNLGSSWNVSESRILVFFLTQVSELKIQKAK